MVVVVGVEEAGCVLSRHLAREQLRFRAGRQFAYVSLLSDMREENELTNPTALILLFFRTTHCCYRHLNPKQLSLRVTDMSRRPPLPREGRGSPLGGAAGGRSGAAGPGGDPASPEGGPPRLPQVDAPRVPPPAGMGLAPARAGEDLDDWRDAFDKRSSNEVTGALTKQMAVLGFLSRFYYKGKRNGPSDEWLHELIQREYSTAHSVLAGPLNLDGYEVKAYDTTIKAVRENWPYASFDPAEKANLRVILRSWAGQLEKEAKEGNSMSRTFANMLGVEILAWADENFP